MELMTVKAFAKATNRYPNHIYLLILKGNKYRKLKAHKVRGKWMVDKSEVDGFPFNPQVKTQQHYDGKLADLEQRIADVEARFV